MANKSKDKKGKEAADWMARAADGGRAGELMQTRFQRIPKAHLNAETVAGVRDMSLGRINKTTGKPTGAPTIRFDTGKTSGANPHINIDPKGRPSPANPHIEVSAGLVKTASVVNKTLRYAGVTLTVAAVAVDSWRLYNAYQDDLYVRKHASRMIEELEDGLARLRASLKAETDPTKKRDIRTTIEHLERVLRDVRRTRAVPVETIKTAASVGGGWSAGLLGGWAGAWGGTQAGAAVGSLFGPFGAVVGAPVGAVVGGVGGGVALGIGGSMAGEAIAEEALALAD